ncbi:MAG: hypothetical protein K2K45_06160 [Muribaculaceae bacterium]|nr:hypothetical protein [Muribaculaceae bacterium]
MKEQNDFPYIGKDILGFRYNAAYPPNTVKFGTTYGGYPNNARQVLFYDFAVQGYDVEFCYNGKKYHLLFEPDHSALCDENYNKEYESYRNPMELIENLSIDGNKLIDIIDELEDVEPE